VSARRQAGVALVMVLLILAVAVAACMALITQQQQQIQAQAAQSLHRHAWQLALEGEARALVLLADPAPLQALPQRALPLRLRQGPLEVSVVVDDLSARLNLNALVSAPGQLDAVQLGRVQRLLQGLDLRPALAWAIVARLDGSALPLAQAGQAAVAGPGPLADISELRALPGLDADSYARLHPHVAALPPAIGLNLNRASAPVLASLAQGLGVSAGQQLLQARPPGGYRSVQAFSAQPLLARHPVATDGLQVAGQAYVIHSRVQSADSALHLASRVVADAGRLRVVSRQLLPVMDMEHEQ